MIIHPAYNDDTAFFAVHPDYDFEEDLDCFYCGHDDDIGTPCKDCGLSLCQSCVTAVGCTCMLAADKYATVDGFVPKPGQCKVTTLSKQQRKKVMRGNQTVASQDEAMWSTLTGKPKLSSAKKCLLAITALSNVFANAIGHQTTFVDPGPHGDHCDTAMIRELKRTIEDQDPSLVYIHVPFVNDNEDTDGYRTLKSFANDQMKTCRTCIIADTRHTGRWTKDNPTLCRGDLAFQCNDKGISNELVEWARKRDNGNPRCTDDRGNAIR